MIDKGLKGIAIIAEKKLNNSLRGLRILWKFESDFFMIVTCNSLFFLRYLNWLERGLDHVDFSYVAFIQL